jgi:NhaP-type Na+/H+ or K+/H+ antiporter
MLEGLPGALIVIVPGVLLGLVFGWMLKKLRRDHWRFNTRELMFATALTALAAYVLFTRFKK